MVGFEELNIFICRILKPKTTSFQLYIDHFLHLKKMCAQIYVFIYRFKYF